MDVALAAAIAVFLAITSIFAIFAYRLLQQEDRIREEIRALRATAAAELKAIADRADEAFDRAKRYRVSAAGDLHRARRMRGDDDQGDGEWTIDAYRAHLERGGRAIPSVERRLGL